MDMAMATTIKSDMKREMETVPEMELGKREAESKQVSRNKEGYNESRRKIR